MEAITGLAGVILGALIGYYLSKKNIRTQIELQQAYDFISKNHFPLLSATKTLDLLWTKADEFLTKDELAYNEAIKNFCDYLSHWNSTLRSTINSGAIIVFENIDKKLSDDIYKLDTKIQRILLNSEDELVKDHYVAITLVQEGAFQEFQELKERLLNVSIPELTDMYRNLCFISSRESWSLSLWERLRKKDIRHGRKKLKKRS